MENHIDFEDLKGELLLRVESYCREFIQGGRKFGREWKAATVQGGKGNSFSLNMENGRWSDFATNEAGGDLISHYACKHNLTQLDSAKELRRWLGKEPLVPVLRQKTQVDSYKIGPPPSGAPRPKFKVDGNPPAIYCYKGLDGASFFYIQRLETNTGKSFLPWSYSHKQKSWVNKHYPTPRPLYGLETLDDGKPVLVVEGEKTANAAREFIKGTYSVITWPGGSNAVNKADWTPLYEKQVLLWPDADEPGDKAMKQVEEQLNGHVLELKTIEIPTGTPVGWDAADALQEKWDKNKWIIWARKNVSIVKPYGPVVEDVQEEPDFFEEPEIIEEPEPEPETEAVVVHEPVVEEPPPPPPPKKQEPIPVSIDEGFSPPSEEIQRLLENAGIEMNKHKIPVYNVSNLCKFFLKYAPDFVHYDEFYNVIIDKNGQKWSDNRSIDVLVFFQGNLKFHTLTLQNVENAITKVAFMNKKHATRDWLRELKWDGVPRVNEFIVRAFGCMSSDYITAVSRNFWISLAARMMDPGIKCDNMLVLEGHQGSLKSSALEAIGGEWYAEINESVNNKDFFLSLQGKILCEIAELDAFNRAEVSSIKRVITTRYDRIRMPYAKTTKDYPRHCIFVGSTNDDNYLRDNSGARRFWPIRVKNIDLKYIKENREQLFAEARTLYTQGFSWWEVPVIETAREQELRRSYDEWEFLISEYYKDNYDADRGLTISQIAKDCLEIPKDRLEKRTQMRIANVLKFLGWQKRKESYAVKWCKPSSLTDTDKTDILSEDNQEKEYDIQS